MTQQVSKVAEVETPSVKASESQIQEPAQKQMLNPENDQSFGSSYLDKLVVGMVAIDFILLPVLLTSGKPDNMVSDAINALSFSLPSAGAYLVARLTLTAGLARWQIIHDYAPRCSRVFRFFFFTVLYYGALLGSGSAIYYTIAHVSTKAGNIYALSVGIISFFVMAFAVLSEWFFFRKHMQMRKGGTTPSN